MQAIPSNYNKQINQGNHPGMNRRSTGNSSDKFKVVKIDIDVPNQTKRERNYQHSFYITLPKSYELFPP
eukprot:UN06220